MIESIRIAFNESMESTLQKRLCSAIRQEFIAGRIQAGQRLPASRTMAGELGLSRTTVVMAYDQMISEGYLESCQGAGTFVSSRLQQTETKSSIPSPPSPFKLSSLGQRYANLLYSESSSGEDNADFNFLPGAPDWTEFPRQLWRRIYSHFWSEKGLELARYSEPAGVPVLREALSVYLARRRGVCCSPEQIVIVNGTQQAIHLLIRICLNKGEWAAIEEPGFAGIQLNLQAYETPILPVPVDQNGMIPEALLASKPPPRLVYVTPSHQYPTGVTLAVERRLTLLDWAASQGALIIEDDYDSELRYDEAPIPAMHSLDRHSTVAYVGSFSDVLLPPLRVGYVVLPHILVKPFIAAKWLTDRQTPTLEQHVLARLLQEGEFERHLRRIKKLYRARRDTLVQKLQSALGPEYRITGQTTGLFVTLWLPERIDEIAVMLECARQGVRVYPLSSHYLRREKRCGFTLGYGSMTEEQIGEGICRFVSCLKKADVRC
ncbi:MAG: PLP-dependent aminotransferase family protein [Vulcanimicrobiota bacterium]